MQVAQKLYEAGLITYMRTDSVQLSPEFCECSSAMASGAKTPIMCRKRSAKRKSSKKDAQEAHEAIRPTDLSLILGGIESKSYPRTNLSCTFLIWMRAIASQCKPAKIRKTVVLSQSGDVQWKAKGQVVEFQGYAKYWKDLSGDNELPQVQQGQALTLENAAHEAKQTKPPTRYTEPKLVQVMEKKGIGRPSTYAPTVKTLKQREYVGLVKGKLTPTELGIQVDSFLGTALPELLKAEFTAEMETRLDAIAHGKQEWQGYLIGWNQGYFQPALSKAIEGLPEQTSFGANRTLEKSWTKCPSCDKAMSKVPSKKVKKKYFLKCQEGCKGEGGLDLVMFWSDSAKTWQLPSSKPKSSEPGKLTEYPCPVCQKPLEEYQYRKGGKAKKMLRCSDEDARSDRKHKDAVYFVSARGNGGVQSLG